jgi:hypothetical protein
MATTKHAFDVNGGSCYIELVCAGENQQLGLPRRCHAGICPNNAMCGLEPSEIDE